MGEFSDLFATLERKQKIYQRKEDLLGARHAARFLPPMTAVCATPARVTEKPTVGRKPSLRELTEQALLQQVVQAAALVNAGGDILYIHGRTGMYLEPAPGESGTINILKMAREGLRRNLTTALHKAMATGETVCCPALRVKTNGDFTTVNLTVRPVAVAPPASPEPAGVNADVRIADLQRELQAKEEYLQSTNEALATVNAELQTKVANLSRVNNDMNNLLAGTGIATLFVDHQLRILRFTPNATQIIHLIQNDIGRPVDHIVSNLIDYDTLTADIKAVLDTLIPKSLDVQSADGPWYNMHIMPYRTLDNIIEGAVLTFVDITANKQANEALRANEERLRVALDSMSIVLSNQDTDLRYTWIHNPNPGFKAEQVIGKTDADLLPEEEVAALTALKRQVLESGRGVRQNVQTTIGGKASVHDLTIEPLRDAAGAVVGLTCAALELTGQQGSQPPASTKQEA